ncbi:restriction endonuclease [Hymenobacter sp. ISL-91]|uniref:restriction endonuclease n=1 Tax=Hymenobacter sp. ISL-91 TaxID=2819151 RepID=UPI001BE50D8B|nr:restriction endonuclease [Hymenobacter sp. ISL-91]MBT2558502.1 restriction endonuclease [Hymenobacter sp. ISL-91]
MSIAQLPTYNKLMKPVLQALLQLGGSGTIEEINEQVYTDLKLSDTQLQLPHGTNGRTEVEYRLAWARTYLGKAGLIENSARKVWALVSKDINIQAVDVNKLVRDIRTESRANRLITKTNNPIDSSPAQESYAAEESEEVATWREKLLSTLLTISPDAFERLAKRILRESGFVQVEVTGKTGDGGIDGKGIVRMSGLLSFHVIFQCKRYRGSISSSQIRDFRGAMQGRSDKGLFITTGNFTRDATKEATRDGAPPIDLIDGELLCDKLKELKLGVTVEMIESVSVKTDWFLNL